MTPLFRDLPTVPYLDPSKIAVAPPGPTGLSL